MALEYYLKSLSIMEINKGKNSIYCVDILHKIG
jgi:hypothetical protein